MNYFRLVRPINLALIVLTMLLVRYALLIPDYQAIEVTLLNSHLQFFGLILSVVFAAAGGYVINDYYDQEADKINKPDKQIIGTSISPKNALFFYGVLVVLSIGSAVVAMRSGALPVVVTLFFNLVLWGYAKQLQRLPFLGNIVISATIAFVPGYVYLYEVPPLLFHWKLKIGSEAVAIKEVSEYLNLIVLFFMQMAFFVNLCRELIKDLQDIKGDQSVGIKTIPIIYGQKTTEYLISGLLFFTVVLIYITPTLKDLPYTALFFRIVPVIFFAFAAFHLLTKKAKSYKWASNHLKLAMFCAILYFPLFVLLFENHHA